jgi:hypothetical protein
MKWKTLSCKVDERTYEFVNALPTSNSEILRTLVTNYVKSLKYRQKKDGIPHSIPPKASGKEESWSE